MSPLKLLILSSLLLLPCCSEQGAGPSVEGSAPRRVIKVVTSTPDLAAIVEEIGGEKVEVESLARGEQNLHSVQPGPGCIKSLTDAELFFFIGLGLDDWAVEFVRASQNEKVQPGAAGCVDVSKAPSLHTLEVPKSGDTLERNLHAYGNPHYWLDPHNGRKMAEFICSVLKRTGPAESDYFERRLADFLSRLDAAIKRWKKMAHRLRGVRVLTYHKSWTYLFRFLNMVEVGTIEPRPGIEPPPSHLAELMEKVRREGVQLLLSEPYYPQRTPKMLASQTGAKFIVAATSVGGSEEAKDYISLIEHLITLLLEGVGKKNG